MHSGKERRERTWGQERKLEPSISLTGSEGSLQCEILGSVVEYRFTRVP